MQPPTHEDKKLDKYIISMRNKVLPEKEFELGGLIDHATGGYGNITKKQRWERAKIKALHNLILSEVESYAKSEARAETAKQIFAVLDNLHIRELEHPKREGNTAIIETNRCI
jgi:hypothetical protein